jgi:ABC-type molybdenum transport system ATPase subunit/photorepair protein PhrA
MALTLAAIATVLRPTNAIIWIVMAAYTAAPGKDINLTRAIWTLAVECREAVISGCVKTYGLYPNLLTIDQQSFCSHYCTRLGSSLLWRMDISTTSLHPLQRRAIPCCILRQKPTGLLLD